MPELARKCIQSLKPYRAGKSIEEVQAIYGISSIVKLGSNENPLGTSPMAVDAMVTSVRGASVYPDGSCAALVKELSSIYSLPENNFLPGNGSNEIFLLTAAAFLNPGEKSLVGENTFSQYACVTRIFDGQAVSIPLNNYRFDLQAFLDEMEPGVKLAFLCNPNNPTGTYLNRSEIEGFLKQVPQTCIIILDEAYAEFADAGDFPDSTKLVCRYPNLLVCRTFSKIYGMGGIRLGYAMASGKLIEILKKVRNFNPFNVNRVAQAGALAALRDRDFFLKSRETNLEGRVFITSELGKMGIECLPSQANFVCFRTRLSGSRLVEGLLQEGVIIRSLDSFGMPEWCRVTVGTTRQNTVFLKALQQCLKQAEC